MTRTSSFLLKAVLLCSTVIAAPINREATSVADAKISTRHSFGKAVELVELSTTSVLASPPSSAPPSSFTPVQNTDEANDSLFDQFQHELPEAMRGSLGASVIGAQNIPIDKMNPDLLAPPTTDQGTVPNAKWPFSLSHTRLLNGGWSRQQNVEEMPAAIEISGVNLRLKPGAIRELHWHKAAEWAYVLQGTARLTAVNSDGQTYQADVSQGDVWYFPEGLPHSLQATDADPEGCEFLLVFDDGNFNEDDTFLLTDWLAHTPKEVIAKNFRTDISAFANIPDHELYVFPSTPPPPLQALTDASEATSQGTVPDPLSLPFSQQAQIPAPGGSLKIVDSTTFKVSKTIAAVEVTVDVGGLRELHWHPTDAEWSYFIEGQARVTIYAGSGNARTFDYSAGDIGYVPRSSGHYVENIGNEPLKFLEIFRTDKFQDVSLNQWLALTPPELVKAHLGIDDATVDSFDKTKQGVV